MTLWKRFIDANIAVSHFLDRLLPQRVRIDGNRYFLSQMLPGAFSPGAVVYDIGGGSRPCVSLAEKTRLGLTVVGIDVSAAELAAAPPGIYNRTQAANICSYSGNGDADVVICQTVLEHVPDSRAAIAALASIAKPGGRVYVFVPCKNALYAKLNLFLPDSIKDKLLAQAFPEYQEGHVGFKVHYDRCTPTEMQKSAAKFGMEIETQKLFWMSGYFVLFVPAYLFWRFWQFASFCIIRRDAAETFAFVFKKTRHP